MTITFTEEEKKYIITDKGNWHVSKDCPRYLKRILENKLKILSVPT